jgi:hypothetical protein
MSTTPNSEEAPSQILQEIGVWEAGLSPSSVESMSSPGVVRVASAKIAGRFTRIVAALSRRRTPQLHQGAIMVNFSLPLAAGTRWLAGNLRQCEADGRSQLHADANELH